jgi:hypothetical protein
MVVVAQIAELLAFSEAQRWITMSTGAHPSSVFFAKWVLSALFLPVSFTAILILSSYLMEPG